MRVLIATATAGAGHLAAAAALEETWRGLRPEDDLQQIDLVKFFSRLHRKIHADGYVKLVSHAPEIWGLMFDKTDDPKVAQRLNRWKRAFPGKSRGKFARFVQQFEPEVVLCTHYLALETLGEARFQSMLVVSVVTDFEAHALWMHPCVDLYCVAAEETRARLIARGAEPENVVATGIPISSKFLGKPNPTAVRKALGLRDDLPLMLVLSGGFGMGPVARIVAELDKTARPFQTVVVTGRNPELRRELAPLDRNHPTHVLGYTSNMHELVAAAELVVTKPGGLTTSEVLAMGKPIFIVSPIPGQEAANSDFLLERGAAVKVNRVEDLPYRLEQLLDSKKLSQMGRAAKALGRPFAARDVCAETLKRACRLAEGA